MHAGFLELENAKMSKSAGERRASPGRAGQGGRRGAAPLLPRPATTATGWRSRTRPSPRPSGGSSTSTRRSSGWTSASGDARSSRAAPRRPGRYLRAFEEAMDDDFNTAGALAALSGLFAQLNEYLEKPPVPDRAMVLRTLAALRAVVPTMGAVLGILGSPTGRLARAAAGPARPAARARPAAHRGPDRRARRGAEGEGLRPRRRDQGRAARARNRAPRRAGQAPCGRSAPEAGRMRTP